MAFTMPPLQLSGGAGGAAGPANGNANVGTPINISNPWNQTKNYQNHTDGSSQSATSSANPVANASAGGGFDMKWILIGAAAWFLLG
jgi:hypothetical protein